MLTKYVITILSLVLFEHRTHTTNHVNTNKMVSSLLLDKSYIRANLIY